MLREVAEDSGRGVLKAPFPWFGGKSRVANVVWARFGDVPNYVEPFAGSLAVLLGRPARPKTETVNDKDGYLINFWRALQASPEALAEWSDWPVSEIDLLARHKWLVDVAPEHLVKLKTDPHFYDAKIAGWWVWGLCSWIGSGWCVQKESGQPEQIPHLGDAGQGINRKLPHLSDAGQGILSYYEQLSSRLRKVRICCGEWDCILGDSVTVRHGITGVFLDPPYSEGEHSVTYSAGTGDVASEAREWAIANGDNPMLRIALCGYEGEHDMPANWETVAWKAAGGFASLGNGRGRDNSTRERIWFSPHCLSNPSLFGGME